MVDKMGSKQRHGAHPGSRDPVDGLILESLGAHPGDLVRHVVEHSGLSRQAINKRVRALIEEGLIEASGTTKARQYRWRPLLRVPVVEGLSEDMVWREHIAPRLVDAPANVREILQYGVTEMVNNVIDHSGANQLVIVLRELEDELEVFIEDDGVGFTQKLVQELGLEDSRHALLELTKGKLTTDPARHSGEGIFFTSRMCDRFMIWSRDACLMRIEGVGFQVAEGVQERPGTTVRLIVRHDTIRTTREVFARHASAADDYRFARTAVSVLLVRHEGESLVSRSQARRLLARGDQFEEIRLDFGGIDFIGPAFADEVFRVYPRTHADIKLTVEHASEEVARMIAKARSVREAEGTSRDS